jgi:hypothetical protein
MLVISVYYVGLTSQVRVMLVISVYYVGAYVASKSYACD